MQYERKDGETDEQFATRIKLSNLTAAQKTSYAPEILSPLIAKGRQQKVKMLYVDGWAAEMLGVGHTSVEAIRAITRRDPSGRILGLIRSGELNIAQGAREAGYTHGYGTRRIGIDTGRKSMDGRTIAIRPGSGSDGDIWTEATAPLLAYLNSWERKGNMFPHLNPQSAAGRLASLDALIAGLTAIRADIEPRSHVARNIV